MPKRRRHREIVKLKVIRRMESNGNPACPTPIKRAYKEEDVISRTLKITKRTGKPMAYYLCVCDKWHTTRPKKRRKNA